MGHLEILRQEFGQRLLISIEEAAAVLGWHVQSIRNAISAGRWQIPIRRLGGKLCMSVVDLAGWLDAGSEIAVSAPAPAAKEKTAGRKKQVASNSAPAAPPEKRERGRRRKYPPLGHEVQSAPAAAPGLAQEPPKRKRGRPTKAEQLAAWEADKPC